MKAFIYTFPSGEKIDLLQVNAIGAINQGQGFNLYIPIIFKGTNRATEFTVGHGLGKIKEEHKNNMLQTWNDLQTAWELAKQQYYEQKGNQGADCKDAAQHRPQQKIGDGNTG